MKRAIETHIDDSFSLPSVFVSLNDDHQIMSFVLSTPILKQCDSGGGYLIEIGIEGHIEWLIEWHISR